MMAEFSLMSKGWDIEVETHPYRDCLAIYQQREVKEI